MDRVYRSKIDWWVGLILAGAIVAMLGTGVALLVAPPPDASQGKWVAVLTFLFAAFTAACRSRPPIRSQARIAAKPNRVCCLIDCARR